KNDSEISQLLANRLPQTHRILSYTCCKHQNIKSVHGRSVGADIFANSQFVHVERKLSLGVSLIDRLVNLPHIAAESGDGQKSAMLIQHRVNFVQSQAFL